MILGLEAPALIVGAIFGLLIGIALILNFTTRCICDEKDENDE